MICRQCLRAAARSQLNTSTRTHSQSLLQVRNLTTSPILSSTPVSSTVTTTTAPGTAGGHPAATGTSAAQPFSAPLTPSPTNESSDIKPKPRASKTITQSTVVAGTVLKGLNFYQGQPDPVALEDSAYPDWLWGVLSPKAKEAAAGGGSADEYSKSKKQRRTAAKLARREALENPEKFVTKIPIYEQSVDLPSGDGSTDGAIKASRVREQLSAAMRDKRRATIKETNMLKKMGAL